MVRWLKENAELAAWIQTIGMLTAMAFGVVQITQATRALESSALSNEIALRNSASDLLVGINQAALGTPEAAGEYSGHKRLHLMRLHYFYRTFQLRQAGLIDDDGFAAETRYLLWAGLLPDFTDVWRDFREQYRSDFRDWVNEKLSELAK